MILTGWNYDEALIQTYTLPYLQLINRTLNNNVKLYLVTFEKNTKTSEEKKIINEELKKRNIVLVPFKYHPFGILTVFYFSFVIPFLFFFIFFKKISRLHCWCTPAGAMGYILSVLTRKPLVIDSFEPHAEAMVENGEWKKNSLAFKILFWFEKRQIKRASHIIGLTLKTPEYINAKYNFVHPNYFVKPSCIDINDYKILDVKEIELLKKKLNISQKYICVYAGKFGGIYLTSEVFALFKVLLNEFDKDLHFLIISTTPLSEINSLAEQEGLPSDFYSHYFALQPDVKTYLAISDFALNPVKPVPSKRYCTSIKDGEYWASGLPVIITNNISDDSDIIDEQRAGAVLKNLTVVDYTEAAKKMKTLFINESKQNIQTRIKKIAEEKRNFNKAYTIYETIYCNGKRN